MIEIWYAKWRKKGICPMSVLNWRIYSSVVVICCRCCCYCCRATKIQRFLWNWNLFRVNYATIYIDVHSLWITIFSFKLHQCIVPPDHSPKCHQLKPVSSIVHQSLLSVCITELSFIIFVDKKKLLVYVSVLLCVHISV